MLAEPSSAAAHDSASEVEAAPVALVTPAAVNECVPVASSASFDDVRCSLTDKTLLGIGIPMLAAGAIGIIISGTMVGVRKGARTARVKAYRCPPPASELPVAHFPAWLTFPRHEAPMKQMWDERYGRDEYAYGEEPNAFFKACLDQLPAPGRLLLPGEGEGRNAVYAARQGWKVYAFDFSVEGREKALRLADRYGVELDYEIADYQTADIEPGVYDAVALIFTHMHQSIRRKVHRKLASALKPGGHLFLEAYSPEQLGYGTGGPPDAELLYTPADLREDFSDLDIVQLEQVEAEIHEGQYHTGLASVVRLVAKR